MKGLFGDSYTPDTNHRREVLLNVISSAEVLKLWGLNPAECAPNTTKAALTSRMSPSVRLRTKSNTVLVPICPISPNEDEIAAGAIDLAKERADALAKVPIINELKIKFNHEAGIHIGAITLRDGLTPSMVTTGLNLAMDNAMPGGYALPLMAPEMNELV